VQLLQKAKAVYDLPAMLQKLDRYALLVIDDISYVRRSELETSVVFELNRGGLAFLDSPHR
jgi:DNA replication protein DnaC